jgi:polar amino acid transport system substrate-binding protein
MSPQARTVRLVADPYPPYQFEEKGQVRGIDQDTIGEALRALGLRASTTLLTWNQCLQWMQDGKADGVYQMAPTPEREKLLLFSTRLHGHTLGILAGYSYGAGIDALPTSLKMELASQEALARALAEGRVDAILMDQGVAGYLAKKLGLEPMERIEGYELRKRGLDLRIFQRYGVRP